MITNYCRSISIRRIFQLSMTSHQ